MGGGVSCVEKVRTRRVDARPSHLTENTGRSPKSSPYRLGAGYRRSARLRRLSLPHSPVTAPAARPGAGKVRHRACTSTGKGQAPCSAATRTFQLSNWKELSVHL